jgi:hypothetical protein
VRRAAVAALIVSGFGTLWLTTAFLSTPAPLLRFSLGSLLVIGGVLIALSVVAIARGRADDPGVKRSPNGPIFSVIVIAEFAAIFLAVLVLNLIGRPELVIAAVALIVGLHFLPLARILNSVPQLVTGILIIGWTLVCFALPGAAREAATAMGVGIVLLCQAPILLLRAW